MSDFEETITIKRESYDELMNSLASARRAAHRWDAQVDTAVSECIGTNKYDYDTQRDEWRDFEAKRRALRGAPCP